MMPGGTKRSAWELLPKVFFRFCTAKPKPDYLREFTLYVRYRTLAALYALERLTRVQPSTFINTHKGKGPALLIR